jgi:hypothetical protein
MGGALKAISKIAGPIMQIASMFTPAGAIMSVVSKGLDFLKNIGGALKDVAPKAMANFDKKIDKVKDFATNAVGQANKFLTGVGNAAASLGNDQAAAAPAPSLKLGIFGL